MHNVGHTLDLLNTMLVKLYCITGLCLSPVRASSPYLLRLFQYPSVSEFRNPLILSISCPIPGVKFADHAARVQPSDLSLDLVADTSATVSSFHVPCMEGMITAKPPGSYIFGVLF
jgi:hypothetical protein